MDTIDERRVVIQPLHTGWYAGRAAAVDMLRLDLLHPIISGNKWYKLRLNIQRAGERRFKTIVTFGGGHSNHLIATAHAARMHRLGSVGIVRGNYPVLTPTLQQCVAEGMQLLFVSQEDYKRKEQPEWVQELTAHFDEILIVPEGGANEWGRRGAGLIDRFVGKEYTHVLLSVGSGTTLAGLRNQLSTEQHILGFAPMKQGAYLEDHIRPWLKDGKDTNWKIFDRWHFGGFGKCTDELIVFMNDFYRQHSVPLDVVYTGKMMAGVRALLDEGYFPADARLLCIHTGGLQGNSMVADRLVYPGMGIH